MIVSGFILRSEKLVRWQGIKEEASAASAQNLHTVKYKAETPAEELSNHASPWFEMIGNDIGGKKESCIKHTAHQSISNKAFLTSCAEKHLFKVHGEQQSH